MANIQSAKKRIRQEQRKAPLNSARRNRIRTFLRRVEEAITSEKKLEAQEALRRVQPELMRGVTKGVWKKKTASRKMSRLNTRVKALAS